MVGSSLPERAPRLIEAEIKGGARSMGAVEPTMGAALEERTSELGRSNIIVLVRCAQ